MNPLLFSLRNFWRELKSGEVAVLMLALTIAVGAVSAVGFVTDRVGEAVARQAGESLAADLVVVSRNEISDDYVRFGAQQGLRTARVLVFPSVATTETRSNLAEIRAVSDGYPLRGRVRLAETPYGPGRPVDAIPPRGEAWLESRLFGALDVALGDTIKVGELNLRVTGVLEYVPDQGWNFVDIAPTLLVNRADMPASGLLGPGSRVTHRLLFAGDSGSVAALREQLEARLQTGQRLEDIRDGRPEMRRAVERADRFLGLAALVSVLLSAAAIAMAARRYAARETDGVAILKCLGARRRTILGVHALQMLWIGLAGGFAGVTLGFGAQAVLIWLVQDLLAQQLPAPGMLPGLVAAGMGLLILGGFGLPPILQLGRTPPIRVLRRELGPPPLPATAVYLVALLTVVALLFWRTGDALLTGYVLGGALGGVLLLAGGAWLLVWALGRLRGKVGVAGRYGVANIVRRGRESIAQVVAFGLGILVLLLLSLVRTDLLDGWRATLPPDAPNQFLINIQPDETAGVRGFFASHDIAPPQLYPMVRARLAAINGTPVEAVEFPGNRGRWFVERDHNLSWADEFPAGNTLTTGEWWQGEPATPEISLEADVARDYGFELGDRLTFNVAGEDITATLTSLREIAWDSFHPNFFIVFSPGALQDYPATYITSFHLPHAQTPLLLELVRAYPSVTVFDLGAIIQQVRTVMDQATLAVEYVFIFTLAAGLVVLLAAVQSTREERLFESAMLRTLGASRRVVFAGVAAEFTLLGLLAGLLAAITASAVGYLLATQVFELAWQANPWLWAGGAVIGTLLVGITGVLATRRVVTHPPLAVLRRDT